jgi:hypothetical protein
MRQGGCLCGAVRYRIEGEPNASGICHCRSCRKAASAPALPFVQVPADRFAFTRGEPAEFRSSPPVLRSFCGRCGSPLTYRSDDEPGCIDVMTCSLDDPEAFPPAFRMWASHEPAWQRDAGGLPSYATTPTAGEVRECGPVSDGRTESPS